MSVYNNFVFILFFFPASMDLDGLPPEAVQGLLHPDCVAQMVRLSQHDPAMGERLRELMFTKEGRERLKEVHYFHICV